MEAFIEVKRYMPTEALEPEPVMIIIPQCCREGWDTCRHATQKVKPKRGNIAL